MQIKNQTAQTIVITGANSGIGLDAAQKLAARGHRVYVACRTQAKADATAQATGAAGAFECDLSSLQSVRRFLDAWGDKPIDVLCLNAGVAMNTGDKTPKFTREGFEETIGVNHFGHFLVAQRLLGACVGCVVGGSGRGGDGCGRAFGGVYFD